MFGRLALLLILRRGEQRCWTDDVARGHGRDAGRCVGVGVCAQQYLAVAVTPTRAASPAETHDRLTRWFAAGCAAQDEWGQATGLPGRKGRCACHLTARPAHPRTCISRSAAPVIRRGRARVS